MRVTHPTPILRFARSPVLPFVLTTAAAPCGGLQPTLRLVAARQRSVETVSPLPPGLADAWVTKGTRPGVGP